MSRTLVLPSMIACLIAGCATQQKAALWPARQSLSAGSSAENRAIEYMVFGNGRPVVFFIAGIHGNEPDGIGLVYKLAEYLDSHRETIQPRQVILLPVANPDGLARGTRFNANGVDINRNFPADNRTNEPEQGTEGLSEPEARIIYQLINQFQPSRIVSLHQPEITGWGWIDYDGPAMELAERMAEYSGLPIRKLGSYPGSLGAYTEARNIPLITFEQPRNFQNLSDEQLWEVYGPALLAVICFPEGPPDITDGLP